MVRIPGKVRPGSGLGSVATRPQRAQRRNPGPGVRHPALLSAPRLPLPLLLFSLPLFFFSLALFSSKEALGESPGERIDRLRGEGKYFPALIEAFRMQDSLSQSPTARTWQREDAARLVSTLTRAAALSPRDRSSLARADQSEGRIRQDIIDGRYREALRLARAQLETRRRLLGPEHQEVARSMKWIADVAADQLRSDQAPGLQAEVLSMRRRILGELHPETAQSLQDYGLACKNRRILDPCHDLETAADCYERSLEINREILGNADPATLSSLYLLADLARSRGLYEEAAAGLQEVLSCRRRVLGPDHPDVAVTMSLLAHVLLKLSQFDEASRLADTAAAMIRGMPGAKLTDRSFAFSVAGAAAYYQGRYAEAEQRMTEALRILEFLRTQGSDDPMKSNHSLVNYLTRAGAELMLGDDEAAWTSIERAAGRRILDALVPPDTSVARFAGASGDIPDRRFPSLRQVQATLPDSTALIGWLSFGRGPATSLDDRFWAYLIRKTGPVRFIRNEAGPEPAPCSLPELRNSLAEQIENTALWPGHFTDLAEVDRAARGMYRELFAPLEPHLGGITKLIVEQVSPEQHSGRGAAGRLREAARRTVPDLLRPLGHPLRLDAESWPDREQAGELERSCDRRSRAAGAGARDGGPRVQPAGPDARPLVGPGGGARPHPPVPPSHGLGRAGARGVALSRRHHPGRAAGFARLGPAAGRRRESGPVPVDPLCHPFDLVVRRRVHGSFFSLPGRRRIGHGLGRIRRGPPLGPGDLGLASGSRSGDPGRLPDRGQLGWM